MANTKQCGRGINCFIPYNDYEATRQTVDHLSQSPAVDKIFLLANDPALRPISPAYMLKSEGGWGSNTMRLIAGYSTAPYSLIYTKTDRLTLGWRALERFLSLADDTRAGMLYADHYVEKAGKRMPCPVIDYQPGSLRDDFDFGSVLFYRAEALKEAVSFMDADYYFAGLYDLRLKVSQQYPLVHVNEYLYTEVESDSRLSGERLFDYVDPKNRALQIEMEAACTDHLKRIGGYLPPHFRQIHLDKVSFPVEASVIIPVRNRVRTIEDAIRSVFCQKTSFPFNLIVVDNHSTDGTTEKIHSLAADKRLLHLLPERNDLGIGGCWNVGVHHPACGKFAVQLDSDDVYSDTDTLQKIVNAFYAQQCAMVIGTYQMTDFRMQPIPPGIIDHREWTPDNGRNNALRINGLGAPRAFYTPVIRQLNFPNTSYGEDYAVGLRISREYRIGRIYEVLYLCRRWEDNSDAALSREKMNEYNRYKDKLRTWELEARKHLINV